MALLLTTDIEAITPDLTNEERETLIESAEAIASHYAPCLRSTEIAPHIAAVAKAVIKKAIEYDVQVSDAGGSTHQHEQLGPYGVTNFAPRVSGTFFSPSQVEILRSLCASTVPGVYSIPLDVPDTLPGW